MSIQDLAKHVEFELRSKPSLTLDAATLRRLIDIEEMPITRRNCNMIAEVFVRTGTARFSTVEFFQRQDNGEVIIYMIFARTLNDQFAATAALQEHVVRNTGEPAEINPHIIIAHPPDRT